MTSVTGGLKRKHRITKLRLGEVSFVDEGDNPGAEVLITKRREIADTEIMKSRLAEVAEAVGELAELAAGSSGEEGVEKAATILGGMEMDIDQLNERLEQFESDITTITKAKDDAEKRAEDAEKALAEATAEIEKLKAAGKTDDNTGEDDILKGLPQAVRDRIEKAEKAAADALESVEKARDKGELDECISKMRDLGVTDAEGMGGVLHRIQKGKSTPEDGTKLLEILTIAKNVGDKGAQLFTAIGKAKAGDAPATGAEEADGKLNEAVEAIMKAKPSLTKEQAYAEALDANPALYEQISKRVPQPADA